MQLKINILNSKINFLQIDQGVQVGISEEMRYSDKDYNHIKTVST